MPHPFGDERDILQVRMANKVLVEYIVEAKRAGVGDESLRKQLAGAGWRESDVVEALQAAEVLLRVPVAPPSVATPLEERPVSTRPQRSSPVASFVAIFLVLVAIGGFLFWKYKPPGFSFIPDLGSHNTAPLSPPAAPAATSTLSEATTTLPEASTTLPDASGTLPEASTTGQ